MLIRPGAADAVWRREKARRKGRKGMNMVGREHQKLVEMKKDSREHLYFVALTTFDRQCEPKQELDPMRMRQP